MLLALDIKPIFCMIFDVRGGKIDQFLENLKKPLKPLAPFVFFNVEDCFFSENIFLFSHKWRLALNFVRETDKLVRLILECAFGKP